MEKYEFPSEEMWQRKEQVLGFWVVETETDDRENGLKMFMKKNCF